MLVTNQIKEFHKNGYLKFTVKDKSFLNKVRYEFLKELKKFNLNTGNIQKKYHEKFLDLKKHHQIQSKFQKFILKKKYTLN